MFPAGGSLYDFSLPYPEATGNLTSVEASTATVSRASEIREHLLEVAQAAVAKRYPAIRLESPIQGWAYVEQFRAGIEAYEAIANPLSVDDRWLGVCYFQLLDDMQALEAFYRAVARGESAARINLAHLLRFLERGEEAARELRAVHVEGLNEYDRVFLLRVTSLDEENNGNLREALRTAEEAWKRVQGLPEFELLAPPILAQLGILHGRIGRAQRALWFLERGLQVTVGLERTKVQLRRVPVLTNLGRHHESMTELEAISKSDLPPSFAAELDMLRGEISWAQGRTEAAAASFHRCLASAAKLHVTYEEFVSRLALVALASLRPTRDETGEHLARAQSLISDKSDRLAYRFREIGLRLRFGEYTPEHALKEYLALDGSSGRWACCRSRGS
jgi:tetratricopeptide (TPR) repeat protein